MPDSPLPAEAQSGTDAPTETSEHGIDITFVPRGERLIGLGFANGLMKLVTGGMYTFWAKTEVRRRLWSFTRLNGEPLQYTGTGRELMIGFMIVSAVLMIPALIGGIIVAAVAQGRPMVVIGYQALLYTVFFFLIGNGMYRARRYRLSRTRWRGISGTMTGSPARYGWTYFWPLALPVALTLAVLAAVSWNDTGWSIVQMMPALGVPILFGAYWYIIAAGGLLALWTLPWRSNALYSQMTNETYFGTEKLRYDGVSTPLYKRYLFSWLGSAVIYAFAAAATALYLSQLDLLSLEPGSDPDPTIVKPELTGKNYGIIGAIWLGATIVVGVITSWYRARQYQHFASHTQFGTARFRSEATGKSLLWLTLSNWLIVAAGLAAAAAFTLLCFTALLKASIITLPPSEVSIGGADGPAARTEAAQVVLTLLTLAALALFMTTATTFAQFRSARYFVSRLKLDGPVDLAQIARGDHASVRRGEGLAQVFDLDAF